MFFYQFDKGGKELHHSCLLLTENGEVWSYNEFSKVC